MVNTSVILAIIVVLAFLLFLWLVFRFDEETIGSMDDNCMTSTPSYVETSQAKENEGIVKDSLNKFGQVEHEIDTLSRSYAIERLCSCQDASNTFERIQHLSERSGAHLGVCYGKEVGFMYGQLKKKSSSHLKKYFDDEIETLFEDRSQDEDKMVNVLTKSNPDLSHNFLHDVRREHCRLLDQMFQAHVEGNKMAAMIAYDAVIQKTDVYVENIISASLHRK